MTNTDITPALTPAEWRECVSIERGGGDPLTYAILADPQKAIAWINGNLPDDDPRKITRADVLRIEAAVLAVIAGAKASAMVGVNGGVDGLDAGLSRLAAKLAALLPPE